MSFELKKKDIIVQICNTFNTAYQKQDWIWNIRRSSADVPMTVETCRSIDLWPHAFLFISFISFIRLFGYSSIRLFVCSFIRLFVYSVIRLFGYSFMRIKFFVFCIRFFFYSCSFIPLIEWAIQLGVVFTVDTVKAPPPPLTWFSTVNSSVSKVFAFSFSRLRVYRLGVSSFAV